MCRIQVGGDYVGLQATYVSIQVALFASYLFYIPIFFWMRGNIIIPDDSCWKFSFRHETSAEDPDGRKQHAQAMILYGLPFTFMLHSVMILPWLDTPWPTPFLFYLPVLSPLQTHRTQIGIAYRYQNMLWGVHSGSVVL
jgi:hypothetical protein